jgi:hypothetical protein
MRTSRPDIPWVEPCFTENQRKFPADELRRYAGQFVAWSWGGSRILASDPDRRVLDEKLRAAGIDLGKVVHDYVEDDDVSPPL